MPIPRQHGYHGKLLLRRRLQQPAGCGLHTPSIYVYTTSILSLRPLQAIRITPKTLHLINQPHQPFPLHSLIHPLACYHLYPIPVTIISRTNPDLSTAAEQSSGAPLTSSPSVSTSYPPIVKPNASTKRRPYQNTLLQLRRCKYSGFELGER